MRYKTRRVEQRTQRWRRCRVGRGGPGLVRRGKPGCKDLGKRPVGVVLAAASLSLPVGGQPDPVQRQPHWPRRMQQRQLQRR